MEERLDSPDKLDSVPAVEDSLSPVKHIVIISNVASHHLYILVLLRIFQDNRITLFINPRMEPALRDGIRTHGNVGSIIPILKKQPFPEEVKREISSADIIILDEPYSFAELIRLALLKVTPRFYLTVYNCTSWFFPRYSLSVKQSLSSLLRTLIIRKMRNIIVMSGNIQAYLREKRVPKNIVYVPFDYPSPSSLTMNRNVSGKKLRVVVPGFVSQHRDYDAILEVFRCGRFRETVTLVLLGPPVDAYGTRIIGKCKEMVSEGFDIEFYEQYPSREKFDSEIDRADVLLTVFDLSYTTVDGQREIFGTTKETGVPFLALTHAKAAILPSKYRSPMEMSSQIIPYTEPGDIPRIIERIIQNPDILSEYQERAVQNALRVDLEPIRKQFGEYLNRE